MCITQALKVTSLTLLIVVASYSGALTADAKTPTEETVAPFTEGSVVLATNKARVASGLPTLTVNETLTRAAQLKANDMVKNGYFAHESPTGVTPWHWFDEAGYTYRNAGENLASGFSSTKTVLKGWLNSPTHKANIMGAQYTEIGIGFAPVTKNGKTSWYVVQMFGSK